ncbi:MAG: nucleotide pyrophosphohydrolase [Candidatus Altiarchaeota archaeon]|nr:nucleotide pyrophosphohydrolase [Candidatus Altiarchaeota archaeon]
MEKLQAKVKAFSKKYSLIAPPEYQALDLVSEVGEFAKEILKSSNYGRKDSEYSEKTKEELGDVLYSILVVANTLEINLDEALTGALKKYEERLKKGSAGSGK